MKVDIENPQAVLEDILTRINKGELVEVTRCAKCAFAEEIDWGLWICHNADIHIDGDYVDEDWFCKNGTAEKGRWMLNPDRECANFVCSVCLEEVDECEERCPHCGVAMKWGEENA